jgi:hypothetical protein
MNKHIQYHDEPMGEPKQVTDFLPSAATLQQNQKPNVYLGTKTAEYHKVAEPMANPYQAH